MKEQRPSSRFRHDEGLSAAELLVVVAILGISSSLIYSGYMRERNRTLAYAAANNIAGWIDATRRSSERGFACLVTLYPSISAGSAYTLATGAIRPSGSSSIQNQCQSNNPLKINAVSDGTAFSISLPNGTPSSFIFTPRGTMFNSGDGSGNGDFSDSIRIRINVVRSGTAQLPSYCVTIRPPLGETNISLSATLSC